MSVLLLRVVSGFLALVLAAADLQADSRSPLTVSTADPSRLRSIAQLAAQQDSPPACLLADDDARWIQRALDGWQQVSGEFLQTTRPPLPWIVLFNTACVWNLASDEGVSADSVPITTSLSFAGSRVAVRAEPHRDTVRLPDGKDIPAQAVAMASVYREGAAAFFVMALPEVWRRDARFAGDPSLERFFLGVMAHEMVHTRHLPVIVAQARALADHYKLPTLQLDDDVIQKRFERVRGFSRAFEAERDVFFRAAAEVDAGTRRALALRGLSMARERRARYFQGSDRMYAEFEDLFLNMEGAAQWAAYRLARAQADPASSNATVLAFVRDNRKFWSQEEGLALFLLLDALMPGWQARVFGPALVSPFALLEEAITRGR